MECPDCKNPLKFSDILKINHKRPYNCPVCSKESGFKHSKGFLNLIAGLAGLAGVIFFYSIHYFGIFISLLLFITLLIIFIIIFFRYAKLEIIEKEE